MILRQLGACAASAFLLAGALPTGLLGDGVALWPLGAVTLVPLLVALRGVTRRRAFALGWLTGSLAGLGLHYWLAAMLVDVVGLSPAVAWLLTGTYALWLGIPLGLVALATTALAERGTSRTWVVPAALVALEAVFPQLFPIRLGHALVPCVPLLQLAQPLGVGGLTALAALVNGLTADVFLGVATRRAALATAALVALATTYGAIRIAQLDAQIATAPTLRVGVIEAPAGDRLERDLEGERLLTFQTASARLGPAVDLLVWPESAYSRRLTPRATRRLTPSRLPLPPNAASDLASGTPQEDRYTPLRGITKPLLFGLITSALAPDPEPSAPDDPDDPAGQDPLRVFNSAWLVTPSGEILGRYDKRHLAPLGEYLPFADTLPFLRELFPSAGALTPGATTAPLALPHAGGIVRLGVVICFEAIFAPEVDRLAPAPDLLVVLASDSWFSAPAERYFHLLLALPRAVEHRRALIRTTTSGISAVIDPVGRVLIATTPGGGGELVAAVPLPFPAAASDEAPPIRFEDGLAGSAALALVVLAWAARKRQAHLDV